jgi:hypothetical protein
LDGQSLDHGHMSGHSAYGSIDNRSDRPLWQLEIIEK